MENRQNVGAGSSSTPHALTERELQFLKGVGPEKARLFERLGLRTIEDLLWWVPRDYQDLRHDTPIRQLQPGQVQVVRVRLEYVQQRVNRQAKPIIQANFSDPTGFLTVTWFNRPNVAEHFRLEQEYWLTGKVQRDEGRWTMVNPKVEALAPPPALATPTPTPASTNARGSQPVTNVVHSAALTPIYALTDGLHVESVRDAVRHALTLVDGQIPETLPLSLRRERDLIDINSAFQGIHFPADEAKLAQARRRLAYEEFLLLQLALALRRAGRACRQAPRIVVNEVVDRRIRQLYPFSLTPGQERAVADIAVDMGKPSPMSRLLQGDVGCGKTAVATYALLAAIANGWQAALMAPTEVLARQHFRTLDSYLQKSRVRRALLVGTLAASERAGLLKQLAAGEIDLVVGTHALVQKEVSFARLGIVVIDEQHKFGVRQRAEFQRQEYPPHQLVMTATPIPRSLGMTWFGDLDITTIPDKPPGRQTTLTRVIPISQREQALTSLEKFLRTGTQGIIVCPRIGGATPAADDDLPGHAATEADAENPPVSEIPVLSVREVADYWSARYPNQVDMVHGQLSEVERDAALERFRAGQARLLVTTVVLEVGMDLPGAGVLLVENAERFGLAQLHQLRGRVGRGNERGLCLLLDGSSDPAAAERLQAVANTNDGFAIAEIDAQARGIGEFVGARQHGFMRLRVGNLFANLELLQLARADALRIIRDCPLLNTPDWSLLRERVLRRYGESLDLALIG